MRKKQNVVRIRRAVRSKRGLALASALTISLIVAFWLAGVSALMIQTFEGAGQDRSRVMLRSACETSLDWFLTQMNSTNQSTYDVPLAGDTKTFAVPSTVISGVAPSSALSAKVTINNIDSVTSLANSYLFDGTTKWRCVTVEAFVGSPKANKYNRFNHKRIRVVLKPIQASSTTTTTTIQNVTTTSADTSEMPAILANTLTFAGTGLVTGAVHSNGDLNLTGANVITGNVSTSGNYSMTGAGKVFGAVQSLGDITLNAAVSSGPVTALGNVTTFGATSTNNSSINAGKNVNLSALMAMNNSSVSTNGTFTTSGAFSMSRSDSGTYDVFAKGGQSASGSFSMNTKGSLVTLGNMNLGWGSMDGKAYYGGANQSPAFSAGAAMNTNGNAIGGLTSSSATYTAQAAKLQSALDAATVAAKKITFPPAADHSANAVELPANSYTKVGLNSITIPPAGYPADGEYYIKGPIDLTGVNTITVRGKVQLSLEGPNAYINMAGTNTLSLPNNNDPEYLQIRTNSSKNMTFAGLTNIALGYIYAPNANVTMAGLQVSKIGGIIANSVTFVGASGLGSDGAKDVFSVRPLISTTVQTPITTTSTVSAFNHWQTVSYQEFTVVDDANGV